MFDLKNKYVKLIFHQGMSAEGFVFYQDKEQLALKTENTQDVLVVNKYLDTVVVVKIIQNSSSNYNENNKQTTNFHNKTFKPKKRNWEQPVKLPQGQDLSSRAVDLAKTRQQQSLQEKKEIQEYLTNHPNLQDKDLTQNYEYPDLTKLKPFHHSSKKNR